MLNLTGFHGSVCHLEQVFPSLHFSSVGGLLCISEQISSPTTSCKPLEDVFWQVICLVFVPPFPQGYEHALHGFMIQVASQSNSLQDWTVWGFDSLSHRVSSAGSREFLPAQDTFLYWTPKKANKMFSSVF